MPFRSISVAIVILFAVGFGVSTLAGDQAEHDLRAEYVRPALATMSRQSADTDAQRELGKSLFFDRRFSSSQNFSCASCHVPSYSWTDSRARAQGEGAAPLAYRSPTLLNVGFLNRLGWDGKFRNLESVAFTPITAAGNMNLSEAELLTRLALDDTYVKAFRQAFEDGQINRKNVEIALAAFERTLVSGTAPFDRYVAGETSAISRSAANGFLLFNGKARCSSCHSGWAFTDGSFHDIGSAKDKDIGRGRLFPTSIKLQYAFKTPTLRNVAVRPPFMHNGSLTTLEDVIDLYDRGGIERPSRSELIQPLGLSATEKADLVAFLKTLTETSPELAGDVTDLH